MGNFTIVDTEITDLKVIRAREFCDPRGSFCETYNQCDFAALGVTFKFVQHNECHSIRRWTIRGLHFQIAPFAQAKLVRVVRGAIADIAVDIRVGSRTYGSWVRQVLSAQNREQFLIPEGFAHGYCTLEPDSIVVYQMTEHYSPEHERGIRWDDAILKIDWGVGNEQAVVSERDRRQPCFNDLPVYFKATAR
jgi:dTDP-4-dehydrorhamnose 3,5-epimerase